MMRVTLKIPSAPKRVLVTILARKGPVGATNGRVDAARDPEYTPMTPLMPRLPKFKSTHIEYLWTLVESTTWLKKAPVCRKRPPASLAAPPESMCVLVEKC